METHARSESNICIRSFIFGYDGSQHYGCSGYDSMEEVASVKLYPNPSVDGIFTITASDDYEVEVVTFDGKVIYYTKMENGMVRLDLSAQPKGVI